MKKTLKAIAFFILVLLIFFGRTFTETYMHGDFIAYWVPNFKYVLDHIAKGEIPWWQPYSYLGLPEIFKLELTLFYPLTAITLLINVFFNNSIDLNFIGKSIEIMQYINLLLGAYGMYKLLSEIFKTTYRGAIIGGLIFVLSFYVLVQSGDISSLPGKLLLPWMTLYLLRFMAVQSARNYTMLVFINIILFTLGYPYNFIYFFIYQLAVALFSGVKKAAMLVIAYLNSVLIAGIFLLPGFHVMQQSMRGSSLATDDPFFHLRNSYIPTKILNIFNPQVFTNIYDIRDPLQLFSLGMLSWGVFPLLLIVIGIYSGSYYKKYPWLYIVFVLGIVLSLGGYLDVPRLLGTALPFLEKLRSHSQILSLTFFTGVIIAINGYDSLFTTRITKPLFLFWQVVVLISSSMVLLPIVCRHCAAGSTDIVVGFARSLILLTLSLVLVHIACRSKKQLYLYVAICLTILEFSFYSQHIPYLRMPTSYADYYKKNSLIEEIPDDQNIFRYSFVENQFIYNTSMHKIFNLQGYETVPYTAFYELNKLDRIKMLRFTNTKYLVTNEQDLESKIEGLSLIRNINPMDKSGEIFYGTVQNKPYFSQQKEFDYYVYKIDGYYPRFFVPKEVKQCRERPCNIIDDPIELTYTYGDPINMTNPPVKEVEINIKKYSSSNIVLEVTSPKDVFVASSEIWDKGWSLSIDGMSNKVYNVNNGFRGFIVPSGKHSIHMSYFPPQLKNGVFMSLIGTAMYLIVAKKLRLLTK